MDQPQPLSLLTLNGVPPQVIAAPPMKLVQALVPETAECRTVWRQRADIFTDRTFNFSATPDEPAGIRPFMATTVAIGGAFLQWGANLWMADKPEVALFCKDLCQNQSTFPADDCFHTDDSEAASWLIQNRLTLRLLWTNSMPAEFLDVTSSNENPVCLPMNRRHGVNTYDDRVRALATRTLTPAPGEMVLFDTITPHQPKRAKHNHRRVLASAFVWLTLPSNWRERVRSGDVPVLPPTLG